MSRLYLRCAICNRQQADGLLSGAAWGRLELPPGTEIEHPALRGAAFRACPTCIQRHPDWQSELLVSLGALSRIHGIEAGVRCVRYTPCAPAHHHHLVCQACGRVEELAAKTLDQRIAATARSHGFRPLGHTVEIVGLCPECRG